MARHHARRARRRRRGALAGVGAAALLLALVAGLPWVLVTVAGNPLRDIGAGRDLWAVLTTPDDGQLFLRAMAMVGWAAWASFAVSVLVEIPAQIRGRRTVRIPGFGLQQRFAAGLVAAVAALLVSPAPAAVAALPGPPVAVAIAATAQDPAAPAATGAEVDQASGYVLHTVERGESLLGLSERYGVPLAELAAANYGVPQPDGRSLQPGQARVYPGWTLRVPVTGAVAPATPAPAPTTPAPEAAVPVPEAAVPVPEAPLAPSATAGIFPAEAEPAGTRSVGVAGPTGQLSSGAAGGIATEVPAVPDTRQTGGREPATQVHQVAHVYQVVPGDWLGGIAERFLGDFDRYPEIAALNPRLETRDHRFPDHIEPTWQVVLPADAEDRGSQRHATGEVVRPAAEAPGPSDEAGGAPVDSPGAESPAPEESAPEVTAGNTVQTPPADQPPWEGTDEAPQGRGEDSHQEPGITGLGVNPGAAPGAAPGAVDAVSDEPDEPADGLAAGAPLATAGLLAALVLGTVVGLRRRQQQHRRPYRRLPEPRGGMTERDLRVAEQPADVGRLDAALRHLASGLAGRPSVSLPDVVGIWIDAGAVKLHLRGPCARPPEPWLDHGQQWVLPAGVALADVSGQVPPLPTLVTVGSQPGRHLLLDLERLGTLCIGGDPRRALDLLRYLASELACNTWSDDVDVVVAGLPPEQGELLTSLRPDRVHIADSVPAAVEQLRRRVGTVTATLRQVGAADTFAGRTGDLASDAWMPQVLLVADPDGQDVLALAELGSELAATGRCAVAVATTFAHAEAPLGANAVTVTADGVLHVATPALRTSAVAARLSVEELVRLAGITRTAGKAEDRPTPPAAEIEPWAEDTDASGSIHGVFVHEEPPPAAPAPPPGPEHDEAGPAYGEVSPWSTPPRAVPARPASRTAGREVVTAVLRERRSQLDPHLNADLAGWRQADPTRPRISILGPVDIAAPGPEPTQRLRLYQEMVVYLAQCGLRGADRDELEDAFASYRALADEPLRVAIARARRWLGESPAGAPWLSDLGADHRYRIVDGCLFDWHLFRRLRTRGEAYGQDGGEDLRAALELVRGIPLENTDRAWRPSGPSRYGWLPESEINPPHLVSAIVDTAHELAELCLDADDTAGARWAVRRGWLADPYRGDDELWRDLMRVAHAEGRLDELRQLVSDMMFAREVEVPEELHPETHELVRSLLPDPRRTAVG